MNPTAIEGTSESAPLKPTESSKTYLPVAEVGRTLGTTYFLVSTLLASIIPIFQLGFGLYYKGECPINQHIPTYLIVAGVCGLALVGLSVLLALTFKCLIPDSTALTVTASLGIALNIFVSIILAIFVFIWFIVGCAWVFGIHDDVQFKDSSKQTYCDPILYRSTFALLIIMIIWAVFQFCLSCFRWCCVGQSPQ